MESLSEFFIFTVSIFGLVLFPILFWVKNALSKYPTPTEECIETGDKYASVISGWKEPINIFDKNDECKWKLEYRSKPPENIIERLFRRKYFCILNSSHQEIIKFERTKYFPSTYSLIENDISIAKLKRQGFFKNRYKLEFVSGETWQIHMPLYTMHFWAESSQNKHVWITYPHTTVWIYLVEPGTDNIYLIYCLAFVHITWWKL